MISIASAHLCLDLLLPKLPGDSTASLSRVEEEPGDSSVWEQNACVLVPGPAVSFSPGLWRRPCIEIQDWKIKAAWLMVSPPGWGELGWVRRVAQEWAEKNGVVTEMLGLFLIATSLVCANRATVPGRAQRASSDEWRFQVACSPLIS